MKKIFPRGAVLCALCFMHPVAAAEAAGTYMGTAGYQSPQRYYTSGQPYYGGQQQSGNSGYAGGNYYQRGQGYGGGSNYQTQQQSGNGWYQPNRSPATPMQRQQQRVKSGIAAKEDGFYLNAGVSRQYGQWNFDMNESGSILNYSDIAWNVLDVKAAYKIGIMSFDGGLQYGMQAGASWMTDDDITRGGTLAEIWKDPDDPGMEYYAFTKVLSIGESTGGSMLGLNFGVGILGKLGFGKVKITPSVGYRMLNYKLSTANNNGLSVSNWEVDCLDLGGGQKICAPLVEYNSEAQNDGYIWTPVPGGHISNGATYSFSQTGTTHAYDVSWNGPYAAMDVDYGISESSAINARIEVGMPGYKAEGDQPYRNDWTPNALLDEKDMFGAMHIGLATAWNVKISDSLGLNVGLTYDYYSVSGASATTKLNGEYYLYILNKIFEDGVINGYWPDTYEGEAIMYETNDQAASIGALYEACGEDAWTCRTEGEVNSFYRSIGARVGLSGKF